MPARALLLLLVLLLPGGCRGVEELACVVESHAASQLSHAFHKTRWRRLAPSVRTASGATARSHVTHAAYQECRQSLGLVASR
jgi:hypothetical protein